MSPPSFGQELKQHRTSSLFVSSRQQQSQPPPQHQQQHIEVCVRLRPLHVEMNTSSNSFFHTTTTTNCNSNHSNQPLPPPPPSARQMNHHHYRHSYMNGTASSTATSSTLQVPALQQQPYQSVSSVRKPSIPRPGFATASSSSSAATVPHRNHPRPFQPSQITPTTTTPTMMTTGSNKPSSPDSTTSSSMNSTSNNNINNTTTNSTTQPPPAAVAVAAASQYAWTVLGDDTVEQNPHCGTELIVGRTHMYTLDHVYGPEMNTHQLYQTCITDRVHAAMQGYHAAILAYGQTATGKTHTMTGTLHEPGIIPLAIRECFSYIKHSTTSSSSSARNNNSSDTSNTEYLLRLSYMEVYKEHIKDLLAPTDQQAPPPPVRLFEGSNGTLQIRGIREIVVTSPEQVFTILADGESRRHVNATHSNTHSSRSHVLVRLWIESRTTTTTTASNGKSSFGSSNNQNQRESVRVSSLSLVDLAGSESVRLTGSSERRSEGHYINKSLMTLGQVVYALSEQSNNNNDGTTKRQQQQPPPPQHVPYRDSKLTRLLQPSLSGNAQVVLMCCISPQVLHMEESHNTLKFAIRAKRIPQRATVQEQSSSDELTLLQSYRSEIEDLKQQLKEAQEITQQQQPWAMQTSYDNTTIEDDTNDGNDEMKELMNAIQKMEQLILKTQPNTTTDADDDDDDLIDISNGGGNNREVGTNESFSINTTTSHDIESRLLALTVNPDSQLATTPDRRLQQQHVPQPQSQPPLTSNGGSHHARRNSVGSGSNNQYFTPPRNQNSHNSNNINHGTAVSSNDGNAMRRELARIQGLLGSVMKKRNRVTLDGSSTTTTKSTTASEEEVRNLRAALEQQEVATSLRQADSSFLQAQLEEKDNLLAEVSKLLESVEERQSALEAENLQLRHELKHCKKELSTLQSTTNGTL